MISDWMTRVDGTTRRESREARMYRRSVVQEWREEHGGTEDFGAGDEAAHPLFGRGPVLRAENGLVTVAFPSGEKTVRASFLARS